MRAAMARSCGRLEMVEFPKDSGMEPASVDKGEIGLSLGEYTCRWSHRFSGVMDTWALEVVTPVGFDFLRVVGRSVGAVGAFRWAAAGRAEVGVCLPASIAFECDQALSPCLSKRTRLRHSPAREGRP